MDVPSYLATLGGFLKSLSKRLFPMLTGEDDNAWARHANPVSAWSRILLGLPLLVLSGWSRVWIAEWWIVILIASAGFLWINPRMTPMPKSAESWSAQAIAGELRWVRTRNRDLPQHHRIAPRVLIAVSIIGHLIVAVGVLRLEPAMTGIGFALALGAKVWFLDRMAWLCRDAYERSFD